MPRAPASVTPSATAQPVQAVAFTMPVQAASVARRESAIVEHGYSVVRRKLLLKNRGPQDAPGLCARAASGLRPW